ncbi:DUF547 domain-containing protein [Piscinibacter sp.]|uniref:DUF547 domain-containing protein n=1 Tax=Piscinibacter sp. TaxID=1903157 RepID=UPI002CBD0C5C|nr:DUF547 domain-containing protein [Albitalea sp.]HUG20897.1 DUF547 domain-containing protein [Albitalea sp.]
MKKLLILWFGLVMAGSAFAQIDHGHRGWDALVKKHVKWLPDNKQSRVDYAGFKSDQAELKQVLDNLSAVPRVEFDGWTKPQQMAFLINAYNAFTVDLILTRYPDVKSIKDLGSLLRSPWRKPFFMLLGAKRHLDWIEHEQLRPNYADPRVHAAVNCASTGCPALRHEAFTADRLEAQLDDGMLRFMGDRARNRVRDGQVEASSIFKWFREDFGRGHQGFRRVEDVFARYAAQLSDDPAEQAALRAKTMPVSFLAYDWSLNVLGR